MQQPSKFLCRVNVFIQRVVIALVILGLLVAYAFWGLSHLKASAPQNAHLGTPVSQLIQDRETAGFVEVKTTQELIDLFQEHQYCLGQEGFVQKENLIQSRKNCLKIPELFLASLPQDFGRHKTQTIEEQKQLFLQALLPFILEANAEILVERQELERLQSILKEDGNLSLCEYQWLDGLAQKYRFKNFTYDRLSELLERVDVIPVAMALGQAAEETGWGSSYAARIKNSVFGITLTSGVKAYESLQHSVKAYMLNLNANPAYAKMRTIRHSLRKQGQDLCALKLMDGLYYYSELHNLYIRKVKSHINHNQLKRFDSAMLDSKFSRDTGRTVNTLG